MNREDPSEVHLTVLRILSEADPQELEGNASEYVDTCVELSRMRPTANPAFRQKLKHQMFQKVQEQYDRNFPRRGKRFWYFSPRLLSFFVLSGLLLLPFVWLMIRPDVVDAQDVIDQARTVVTDLPVSDIQTLEIVQEITVDYGVNTTRTRTHAWYQEPDRWRSEYTSTTHPYSAVSDGTRVSVNDGASVWRYTSRDNTVRINMTPLQPEGGLESVISSARTITTILQQASECYNPELKGQEIVADRRTYVIDMGVTSCPSNSASQFNGRQTLWVDVETFLVLKVVVQHIDSAEPAYIMETTQVRYNESIDESIFQYMPPVGVKVVDLRESSVGQSTPPSEELPTPTPAPEQQEPNGFIQVPFNVFVPSDISPNLKRTLSYGESNELVLIEYHGSDGELTLQVLTGPAGCCLDADPRRAQNPIMLADGIQAHFIRVDPAYGGSILWFQKDGSYIALSGPTMTENDLIGFAESLELLETP